MAENASVPSGSAAHRNSSQQAATGPKIRRRNRIITSCLECRRRKLKCDRSHPCNHCAKASRDCVFLSPALDSVSKGKLNQFKESIDHLEKGLERQAGVPDTLEWNVASNPPPGSSAAALGDPIPEDEQNLEPSPLAIADVAYEDDADDLLDDLGVRLGKVRITERLGGFVRPRIGEEAIEKFREKRSLSTDSQTDAGRFERLKSPALSDNSSTQSQVSPENMAPGASLLFPHTSSDDVSLITFLPSRDFADRLIHRYWIAVHSVARVVHRPSFERQYNRFWTEIAQGFEPTPQLQALVFAALFSAAISLSAEQVEQDFGCSRDDMIRTFRTGCEHALSRSNVIRTTRAITLQALVMYLLPLCRAEITRAQASLVSMAIRLAECAGLHRDPTTFGMSPIDTHVRRLIWYQLCFLDIRTIEAVGVKPTIRTEDYDTRLPLHVEDSDLDSLVVPRNDATRFTDMTVSRIKFEAYDMIRVIWVQRPMVEKGQTSLTALLKRVESFREHAVRKYITLIDKSIPIQNYALKMLQMLFYKMHVNILHRYASSVPQEMPERLMQLVWSSSTTYLEVGIELDSLSEFKPWVWYLGANQQWHVSLLLVFMLSQTSTERPETERIWACVDYLFELPPNLDRDQKTDYAMIFTFYKLQEYLKQRKQRFPTSVNQSLAAVLKSSEPASNDNLKSPYHPIWGTSPGTSSDRSAEVQQRLSPAASESWPSVYGSYQGTPSSGYPPGLENQAMQFLSGGQQLAQPNAYPTSMPAEQGETMSFTTINPPSLSTQPSQPLANLDLDELDRMFPRDDILGSFEPIPGAQTSSGISEIPPMTLFPDPYWTRAWPSNN